jgi:hypothetical protein
VRLQHPERLAEILADAGQDIRRVGIARLVGGLDALVDLLGERRVAVQQRLHMVHQAVRFVGQAGGAGGLGDGLRRAVGGPAALHDRSVMIAWTREAAAGQPATALQVMSGMTFT